MLFPLSSARPSEQALIQETALVSLCLSLVVSVVDDFIMPLSCLDPSSISFHFSVSPDLLSLMVDLVLFVELSHFSNVFFNHS